MNKRLIITIITIVFMIIILQIIIMKIPKKTANEKQNFDKKVVSSFTIDINPSLEVDLNKDNYVVEVKALNEDSRLLTNQNYQGKELKEALKILIDDLKTNNYLNNEENTILINVSSNDNSLKEIIKSNIESITLDYQIKTDLIVLEVEETKELKELAEKSNITIAKAYYIQDIIEDSNLDIDSFKDIPINEIKAKIQEYQEENAEKIEKSNNSENSNQTANNAGWSGCTPPGKATEKIADWCRYNSSRPQACEFTYPDMQPHNTVSDKSLSHLGLTYGDTIGVYSSQMQDNRSSYCISQFAVVTTKQAKMTVVFDSVTGAIIEEKSESVPTPSISEMDAVNILLSYYGLKYEDCQMCQANFSPNGDGSDNEYYRYDTGILMKNGEQHLANINPFTGEILQIIY